jgi:hypothetical protein
VDRRRFLLTSLAGALAAPLAVWAQQAAKGRVIGLVLSTSRYRRWSGMSQLTFWCGRSCAVSMIWDGFRAETSRSRRGPRRATPERFPAIFAELVARRVEVIVMAGGADRMVRHAQRATRTIPLVFFGPRDPSQPGWWRASPGLGRTPRE